MATSPERASWSPGGKYVPTATRPNGPTKVPKSFDHVQTDTHRKKIISWFHIRYPSTPCYIIGKILRIRFTDAKHLVP